MQKDLNNLNGKTIVISRTDSIGDVILTLPMCAWLKEIYPDCKLIFLGKKYTEPILECFPAIDELQYWDEIEDQPEQGIVSTLKSWEADVFIHVFPNKRIAKLVHKTKIPMRIGTSHRAYHLLTCNNRPSFTRKKSDLHESQLNFKLLSALGVKEVPDLDQIKQWVSAFKAKASLPHVLLELLNTDRKKIILHPKSQGSAVEWPLEKYIELAKELIEDDYKVYFSGTEKEGKLFRDQLPENENIIDISGKMKLAEFIAFINEVDGLLACSTGPLHIAAILQKKAIGLYTNVRPMHPGRWAPIGSRTTVVTSKKKGANPVDDIKAIDVHQVTRLF